MNQTSNELSEPRKESFWARCDDRTPRDRRNLRWVMWIFFGWAVAFTTASQLTKRGVVTEGPLAWLLAALPFLFGAGVMLAYARYLRETDELQRLIQLQALALGWGGTFFVIGGYEVLERLGAPVGEFDDATMVMAVFYVLGTVLAWRRYR